MADTPEPTPARPAPWWRRLVVPGIVIAGVAVVAPEIITASFSDLGTFARVAGLVAALVASSWLIHRLVPNRTAATVLSLVPAWIVAFWAVLPYLDSDRIDEEFPVVAAAPAPAETTTTAAPATTAPAPPPSDAEAAAPAETTTTTAPPTTTTTAPPEPVETHRGTFRGLTGHRGSGDAAVYTLADGSRLLRLEEVDVGPGPDLDLYLVPGVDERTPTDGIKVDDLKAERGNQNYELPADLVLDGDWTVLVWCESFRVEVAHATLGTA